MTPGHEEGGVGSPDSRLKSLPQQVSYLLLGAALRRMPATSSLGPWCPRPLVYTPSPRPTVFQAPSLLARLSEEPRRMPRLVLTCSQLQLPMCQYIIKQLNRTGLSPCDVMHFREVGCKKQGSQPLGTPSLEGREGRPYLLLRDYSLLGPHAKCFPAVPQCIVTTTL